MALVLITVNYLLYSWWNTKSCFIDIKSVPKRNEYHCGWDINGVWILNSAWWKKNKFQTPTFHIKILILTPSLPLWVYTVPPPKSRFSASLPDNYCTVPNGMSFVFYYLLFRSPIADLKSYETLQNLSLRKTFIQFCWKYLKFRIDMLT